MCLTIFFICECVYHFPFFKCLFKFALYLPLNLQCYSPKYKHFLNVFNRKGDHQKSKITENFSTGLDFRFYWLLNDDRLILKQEVSHVQAELNVRRDLLFLGSYYSLFSFLSILKHVSIASQILSKKRRKNKVLWKKHFDCGMECCGVILLIFFVGTEKELFVSGILCMWSGIDSQNKFLLDSIKIIV